MNYFEDWYSQPIDNEEEDQEKRLASLLQAAADAPTGGPDYEPQDDFSSASDQASFNPRRATDLIQQIMNRNVADINLGLGDTKDLLSTSEWSADLFGRPADAVDDLDFFDRRAPANLFRDIGGSAGLDDDFWGGLQKGSGLMAQTPSSDNSFNFLLAKTAEPEQSANSWNSPAEAGKDKVSDKPDAAMQLKNFQERFPGVKLYAPPDFPIPKKLEAFQKWYDSLPVKPTGADVKVKIVPKGEPGSEKGNELGNTGLVVVPEKVELGVKVKEFNLDDYVDPREWYKWIRKGFKK